MRSWLAGWEASEMMYIARDQSEQIKPAFLRTVVLYLETYPGEEVLTRRLAAHTNS
jgi:hypothetical protein